MIANSLAAASGPTWQGALVVLAFIGLVAYYLWLVFR